MSKLTAEQVREAIFNGSSYASYDGAKYYADGIHMQTIADELNTRAERTCKVEGSYTDNWEYQTWGFELSCGHDVSMLANEPPKFCPECGAKVVSE